jgi:hypothetical protein
VAISYVGAGTFDSGTTSCLCNFLSGAATDLILALLGNKPYSSSPTVSGYTGLGGVTSGSVANGNGTGSTRATAGVRQTVPTSAGSDTVSVTSGSPTMAIGLRFALGAGASWDVQGFGLTDTDETLVTVTASATIASNAIQNNDWLVISVVLKDDAITHSTQLLTIAGVTHGSITWLAKQSTTSGNDGAMYIGYCQVTGGASNGGTGTYSATSNTSGASAAAVNLIRLREVTSTPTGLAASSISESRIDVSWNSVSGATSYTLERSLDGSTGWSTVYSGSTASYSDTGLASATQYFYRVSATSSLGVSSPSGNVSTATFVSIPFLEDFAGGSWARWTDNTIGSSPTGLTVSSGAGVMTAADETKFARAALRVASQATQGVLLKFTSSTSGFFKLWLRADAFGSGADPSNGVGLRVQPGGSLSFFDAVSGVVTSRSSMADTDSGTSSPSTSTSYWLRFEAIGTTYRWHMWATANPEPTGWVTPSSPSASIPATGILMMSETTSGVGSPQSSITVDDILFYDPTLMPGPAKVGKVGTGLYLSQAVAGGVR